MNVPQRQAWFILANSVVALAACLGLAAWVGWRLEILGGFGLFAGATLTPLIGWSERRAGRVVMDERDREIERQAMLAGFYTTMTVIVSLFLGLMAIKGLEGTVTISIPVAGAMVAAGTWLLLTVQALVTVMMYWNDAKAVTESNA